MESAFNPPLDQALPRESEASPDAQPAPVRLSITSRQWAAGFIDEIQSEPADERGIVPKASAVVLGNRNPNLRTRRNVFIAVTPKQGYLRISAFAEKNPGAMAGRNSSALSYLVNFLIHNRLASAAESPFLVTLYGAVEAQDASGFLTEDERGDDAWVRDVSLAGDGTRMTAEIEVFAPNLSAEEIAARLRRRFDGVGATVRVLESPDASDPAPFAGEEPVLV